MLRSRHFNDPPSFQAADTPPSLPNRKDSPDAAASSCSPGGKRSDAPLCFWQIDVGYIPVATSLIFALALLACLACCWTMHRHWSRATKTFIGQEWWPTISSVVGDNMPERAVFRIGAALAVGPKFVLMVLLLKIFVQYAPPPGHHKTARAIAILLAPIGFAVSFLRCLACGLWIYIGSGEHLQLHQQSFAFYALVSVLEKFILVAQTMITLRGLRNTEESRARWRWSLLSKISCLTLYLISLVSGLPFLYQHTAHKLLGAYSMYAMTEWSAAFFELAFDATAAFECRDVVLSLSSIRRSPAGVIAPITNGNGHTATASNGDRHHGNIKPSRTSVLSQRYRTGVPFLNSLFHFVPISVLDFTTDLLRSLVFWSLASVLPMSAFFSPMVAMRLTGGEVAMFAPVAGILCCYFSSLSSSFSAVILAIAHVSGYIAWNLAAHTTRVSLLGASVSVCFFVAMRDLFFERSSHSRSGAFILGLVVFITLRMVALSRDLLLVHQHLAIIASVAVLATGLAVRTRPNQLHDHGPIIVDAFPRTTSLSVAMVRGAGFGASLGLMAWLYSSHGVIARWTNISPFPWGVFVPISMLAGLALTVTVPIRALHSWLWFSTGGVCSALALVQIKSANGCAFIAGCVLAIWLTSLWPQVVRNVSTLAPKRMAVAVPTGLALYCAVPILTAYVVAYPFVPGGFLLRERPHWILYALVSIVGLSVLVSPNSAMHRDNKHHLTANKCNQSGLDTRHPNSMVDRAQHTPSCICSILLGIGIVMVFVIVPSLVIRLAREHRPQANPILAESHTDIGRFSAMVWAIHFAYDNNGHDSFEKIAEQIRSANAHIVGLLESDLARMFIGNRDIVEYLASELGMYSEYGPSTHENTWGCALLSVYPIVQAQRLILPSPRGELACLIDARVLVNGTEVQVIVTHFGNTPHAEDLQLQTDALQNLIATADQASNDLHPSCLLGYLTMSPYSDRYMRLVEPAASDTVPVGRGMLRDSAPEVLVRYCEYILFKRMRIRRFRKIGVGATSDTDIQLAEFQLS